MGIGQGLQHHRRKRSLQATSFSRCVGLRSSSYIPSLRGLWGRDHRAKTISGEEIAHQALGAHPSPGEIIPKPSTPLIAVRGL